MIPLAVPAQVTGEEVVIGDDTYADFVNDDYKVNGVSVTAADVVDDTGRISASGLSFGATDPVQLLGDFRDTLLPANFTVVVEYSPLTPEFGGHRLYLLDMFNFSEGSEFAFYMGFLFPVIFDQNLAEVPDDRTLFGDDGATAGVTNKTAVTRIDDQLSVSTNGGTVNTETTPMVAATFVTARIGEHNGSDPAGYIRRIDVMAPVDDSELPGLSGGAPSSPSDSPPNSPPDSPAEPPPGAIILEPGDDLTSIVAGSSVSDVFWFTAGTYRGNVSMVPKNSQTFIGADGAVISGSVVLTGWVSSSGRWYVTGQSQQGPVHPTAEFIAGTQRPGYPEAVYRDNVPLVPKDSLAHLVTGSFYLDYTSDTLYLFDNPAGHVIEATKKVDAFHGSATGVTIQNLIVEKFGNQIQDGAINAGVGWVVDGCETRLNYAVGISMRGDGGSITNCYSHDNGEMGLQGGSFSSGSPADAILVEDNILSDNGFWSFIDPLWEGGGCKFTNTTNLVMRGNHSFDNNGSGLWTDINNVDTLYEDNVLSRNTINGISHEISYAAIIRNNTFWGNGFGDTRGWGFGADLNIQTSKDVEAYGNQIEGTAGHNPLVMVQQSRGSGTLGTYECTGNNIHDNIVIKQDAGGAVGGFVDFNAGAMTGGGNVWLANAYHMADASDRFQWNGDKNFAGFVTATGETGTRDTSYPDTSGWPAD